MNLHFLQESSEWCSPAFKVLSNNDTGAAPGNQAGILIPKLLRQYFPRLEGVVSSLKPTIDRRLNAQLFIEDKFVGTVNTRYQFQTWDGERRPEARVTNELGPLRNSAQGGDIVIFQQAAHDEEVYRFTLVRKTSPIYNVVVARIGTRRWGRY